jgi:hypothetical protein
LKLWTVVALLCCLGCAGRAPAPGDGAGATHQHIPLPRLLGPLLDTDADCRMIRHARKDDDHVWIWAEVVLPAGASVRIEGPGSLQATLVDGTLAVDAGLCVRLRDDRGAYLNSSAGPITIRHSHGPGGRVRFLVRLPADVGDPATVRTLSPVPGRWTCRF